MKIMEKHYSEKYSETYYTKVLENGMKVILFHRPGYDKSFFLVGTPFGALDLVQRDEMGNLKEFPAGIAHFLEHKMFEDSKGDIMDQFSQMGVQVNAFTSYGETVYYFSSNDEIEAPLHLLLDFTNELQVDDESVEKEKGIIIQELHMYAQQSDSRLLHETFKSLYHVHPLKYDIGGDDESVNGTTTAQLYDCFHLNYAPFKKVLVGICSEDPNEILQMIETNQKGKIAQSNHHTKRILTNDEPRSVVRKEYAFEMDVQATKVNFAFKLDGIVDGMERSKVEWAMRFGLDTVFSTLNPNYQLWIDDQIINDYFSYEIEIGEDYGVLIFNTETEKQKEFKTLIETEIKKLYHVSIDPVVFEQLKRRYFGQSVTALNSFENTAIYFLRNDFAHVDFFESLDMIYDITVEDIEQSMQIIDLDRSSFVEVHPLHD